ncbi:TolB family protein [Natronincola ferrireducens]|uniref:WD40-like Beta Propeller Repeat n=1 Tax=Natronincola ferrireducens TaxID=393762 RepID=A0A1G8YM64_9FIRM|nr:WD40 repeat domain-containing protein [Natronincola ferrireducens]SDK03816.1 hypothetical protein SAMN05660472_00583 [Natronincola ferrireducens]
MNHWKPGQFAKILLALMLIVALLVLTGCGGGTGDTTAPSEESQEEVVDRDDDEDVDRKKGFAHFADEWVVPTIQPPLEFVGNDGFDEQILCSTGPTIVTISPEGDFLRRIVSSGKGYYDYPVLSPDGTRFVVNADYHEFIEPWEMMLLGDMDTGELIELEAAGDYYYYPASWNHDGTKVIYTAYDEDWLANIYYVDVDTMESGIFLDLAELPIDREVVETAKLHPNKNILYFIALPEGEEDYGVFKYDLDEGVLEQVWTTEEEYVYDIAISPRDDLLAISAGMGITEEDMSTMGLYLVYPEENKDELLFWEEDVQPIGVSFSPCGKYLAFDADTRVIENTWSIYIYDVDGRDGKLITRYIYDSHIEPFSPSWGIIP